MLHYVFYCHYLFFIPQSATALELFNSALAEKNTLGHRILCFSSFENKPAFEAVNCMLTTECCLSQTTMFAFFILPSSINIYYLTDFQCVKQRDTNVFPGLVTGQGVHL